MKKFLSLFLALGLLSALCACAKAPAPTVTPEEIYTLSCPETILQNHESVSIRYTDGEENVAEDYFTADYTYQSFSGAAVFVSARGFYYREGELCQQILVVDEQGLVDQGADLARKLSKSFLIEDTEVEVIDSVTEQEGKLRVASHMTEQGVAEQTYGEYKAIRSEYELDAATRTLLSGRSFFTLADGTEEVSQVEFVYDAPAPQEVEPFLAYDRAQDVRQVTVVTEPGTDKEVTQTVQLPKGLPFLLLTTLLEDSYATYADAACTQAWADVEGYDADTTVYVVWSK